MFSLNKVSLIGRIGNNPELKKTKNGHDYVTISLATNESIKNKSTGEWSTNTSWHRIKMYDPWASVAARNLEKGSIVYIEGSIKYLEYEKDGIKKYSTEILCRNVVVVDKKKTDAAAPLPAPWDDDPVKSTHIDGMVKFDPKVNPLRNMTVPDPHYLNDDIPF